MNTLYMAKVSKKSVKGFYDEGVWSADTMTSMVIEKENGKFVQVFGAIGNYGNRGASVRLASESGREIGYGKILTYVNDTIVTNVSAMYVLK